jgi:hypothetical protein
MEKKKKDSAVAKFEVLCRHWLRGAGENKEFPLSFGSEI